MSKAKHLIARTDARRLIESVVSISGTTTSLSQRRQRLLDSLAELIQADAGHWAWGRGHPAKNRVVPLAVLFFGYTEEQKAILIQMGLDPENEAIFHPRGLSRFDQESQACVVRHEVLSDAEWKRSKMRGYHERMGVDSWLLAVRYSGLDTWSNFFFVRHGDRDEFGPRETAIVDLALASIAWLHADAGERIPPESFVGLTSRQRTVMLMLLDGLSRKQIAVRLDLSEHTVGDHIKSIYKHFGVHSLSELSALFLRNA